MAKIIKTADIHLGVQGRTEDIFWALRLIRTYASESGIDTIIGLGDLFHDRESLSIDIICAAHDYFLESEKKYKQRWIWFPGNHDMFLKHSWKINSLKPLSSHFTLIDTVKILEIDGVRFWVLPFIHFESAYMRVVKRIEDQYQDGDILLTHIGVIGAIKNTCFLLQDWSIVNFEQSPFTHVYTGHFHTTQQVGNNVWYPGSPIPFKFDEGDTPHGFFVFDTSTRSHEFIDIWELGRKYLPNETPPPNYLTIPYEALNDLEEEIIRNNIIRVAADRDLLPNERLEIQEHLQKNGVKTVRWLNVKKEEKRTQKLKFDREDLFEAWLQTDVEGMKGLNLRLLRQLNKEIVKDGNERYAHLDE